MDMTARFKAYKDLNREIDLQIERLEQMEAKAGSPSTPNLSGMPKGSSGLCCGCVISIRRNGKMCFSLHTEESRISMKNTTTTSSAYSATTSKRWQSWRQFQKTNRRIFHMDKTAVFLRIRALTHAIDMIFSNADDGLSEDANTISMMLVELVDEYDRMRTAEAE